MTTDNTAPAGMHTITPHIVVRDAGAASDWYQRALGASEQTRLTLPSGKLMYAELRFGDSPVMVADEFPEFGIVSPLAIGGTAVVLHLFTSEVDRAWQRAVEAGAEVLQPLQDQFWGDRQGQFLDPFGHKWNLAQHLRDVPADELAQAAAVRQLGIAAGVTPCSTASDPTPRKGATAIDEVGITWRQGSRRDELPGTSTFVPDQRRSWSASAFPLVRGRVREHEIQKGSTLCGPRSQLPVR